MKPHARILALIVSLAMAAGLMPTTTFATHWNIGSDSGFPMEARFPGAQSAYAAASGDALFLLDSGDTLKLLIGTDAHDPNNVEYAGQPGKWSISGKKLTLSGFQFETDAPTALFVSSTAHVTIELNSGTSNNLISAATNVNETYSTGLYFSGVGGGRLTISGKGVLIATGGTVAQAGGTSAGIASLGNLTITGKSNVMATGKNAPNSYGISVGGMASLKIDNAAVTALAMEGSNGAGLHEKGATGSAPTTFSSCNITAKGGKQAILMENGLETPGLSIKGSETLDGALNAAAMEPDPPKTGRGKTIRMNADGSGAVAKYATIKGQTYTVTFDANGGTVTPLCAEADANGKLSTLPIPTRVGYEFLGWYHTKTGGVKVTTTTVFSADTTVYAQWRQSSGPNPNPPTPVPSGSSGGSSKSSVTYDPDWATDNVNTGKTNVLPSVTRKDAQAAVNAESKYVWVRNGESISPEVFMEVYDISKTLPIYADTTKGGVLQLRMYLKPELGKNLDAKLLLGGAINGEPVKSKFENYYNNVIATVSFAQNGTFGMPVEVAMRADLSTQNAKSLYFYAYNREANKYYPIQTAYHVDAHNFLHFTTTLAGDIIITDGPLANK